MQGRWSRSCLLQISRSKRSIWLMIAALSVTGLMATLSFAYVVASLGAEERARRIEAVVDNHATVLRTIITRLTNLEVVASAFFAASKQVEPEQFEIFAGSLIGDSRDVLAVLWVPRVDSEERAKYRQLAEARGLRGFSIHRPNGSIVDDEIPVYPTWFASTRSETQVARLGLDWASIPQALEAIEMARDTGQVVASGSLSPWLDFEGRPLSLLALPIFDKGMPLGSVEERQLAVDGYVLLVAFPEAILLDVATIARSPSVSLSFYLLDVTERDAPTLPTLLGQSVVAREGPPISPAEAQRPSADDLAAIEKAASSRRARLTIAGRDWQLIGVPIGNGQFLSMAVVVVLVGGLLVTILLCGLVWSVMGRFSKGQITRLRAIFDSATDGIITADEGGKVTSINRAGAVLFGWSADKIVGQPLTVLMPERYRERHRRGFTRYLETGEGNIIGKGPVELTALRSNGVEFPIDLALGTWTIQGSQPAFAAFVRDSTGRRNMESALVAAKEQAEGANRAKNKFLAKMSHELRTPLNAIVGVADLVRESELTTSQRADIEQISLSADSLLRLVSDILDISRIEAGQLELASQPFSLRAMVENSVQPLIRRAQIKGNEMACRVAPEVPDALIGDSGRLQQIFLNLIGNAVKFTEHGQIYVEVMRSKKRQGRVELEVSVSDTGPGIAKAQQENIFELFVQGDAGTKHSEGVGIGLSTANELVQMMGGHMWVESELGTGSTFRFTVDLALDERAALELRPSQLDGARVLIVDHIPLNRQALKEITGSWGMLPTAVADGAACLDLLRADASKGVVYQLLLLDYELPGQDGIELARAIRADASLPSVPGILLSSSGGGAIGADAQAVGLVSRLEKPVSRSVLLEATQQALGVLEAPAQSPKWEPPRAPLRVLLAEDNPINQLVTSRMLAHLGHQARSVGDGKAAVDATEREDFDVVLMDYDMPIMTGLEATQAIRKREGDTEEPLVIIALTAYAMEEDRVRLLEAGMDQVLTKPVRLGDLAAALDSLADRFARGRMAAEPRVEKAEARVEKAEARAQKAEARVEKAEARVEKAEARVKKAEAPPVIDMAKLAELGGSAGILDLIAMLEVQAPQLEGDIRAAIEAQDPDRLRLAAHTLKGSLGLFGAAEAVSAARGLEEIGRARELNDAEEALDTLHARLEEVRVDLVPVKAELEIRARREHEREQEQPRP